MKELNEFIAVLKDAQENEQTADALIEAIEENFNLIKKQKEFYLINSFNRLVAETINMSHIERLSFHIDSYAKTEDFAQAMIDLVDNDYLSSALSVEDFDKLKAKIDESCIN